LAKPSRVVGWILAGVASLVTFALLLLMALVGMLNPAALDWRLLLPSLAAFALMAWAWVNLFRRRDQ